MRSLRERLLELDKANKNLRDAVLEAMQYRSAKQVIEEIQKIVKEIEDGSTGKD